MTQVTEKISVSQRKVLRDIQKILGKNILKFLAEPLTNSDDSYERLEKNQLSSPDDVKQIEIILDSQKREIAIVDHAEGMDREGIVNIFKHYGENTSRSKEVKSVRGMFGQGATDVLFASVLDKRIAKIASIRNGTLTELNFSLNGADREFSVTDKTSEIDHFRKEYGIPSNGTVFMFGIPKDVTLTKTKNLVENLSKFYMLRFLFSKPNRQVVLFDKVRDEEMTIKYDMDSYLNLPVLLDEQFQFKYLEDTVSARIDIRYNPDKNSEDGILIHEDKIVFDNQFFDRRNTAGMDRIEGTLQLEGALEIIRKGLDDEKPEEIITDSRDGFNRNHDFFRALKKSVEPYLIRASAQVMEDESNSHEGLKSKSVFRDIFKELNQLMKEELQEIPASQGDDQSLVPPLEGIRFVRPSINITLGKQYYLKLIVNTSMVKPGTTIQFLTNSKSLSLKPEFVIVPETEANPSYIDVYIEGLSTTHEQAEVQARTNDYNALLFVNVIEKAIYYPNYGLEFNPNEMNKKPATNVFAHLFVSLDKYPIGTLVSFQSNNEDIGVPTTIKLDESHKVSSDIAMIQVEIKGGIDNTNAIVTAIANKYETKLKVNVREREIANPNRTGYIHDIDHKPTGAFVQSYYDANSSTIYINSKNPENNVFLKSWFDGKDLSNEQHKFIAELASTEVAKIILKKQIDGGKLDITDFEVMIDELQKEKFKVFSVFLKSM